MRFDELKLAVDLKNDLQSVLKLDEKWLVEFNNSKTKLISFNHM